MNFVEFFNKNKSIVGFLILEVLALLAFNFANISEILYLVGAVISITSFVFIFATTNNKKEFYALAPMVVVLFIVSGIAAFGNLSHSFSTISNVATFFALPLFFSMGFCARRMSEIKVKYVVLAIGFGFALLTLIGTFATWIDYGFFYSIIYKIKGTTNYYYNGLTYDVTKEMNWLIGFSFSEVVINYGGLFAIICASFLPALLFINYKENRSEFLSCAVIGGIGLLSIITIPNFTALAVLVVASLFAFIYKFLKGKEKILNGLGYAVLGIVGAAVVLYSLTIINASIGFKFGNRIFVNNGIMKSASEILEAIFIKDGSGKLINFMGINLSDGLYSGLYNLESVVTLNSGILEYQILKEVGVVGSCLFVLFLVAMVYFAGRYIKKANDEDKYKAIFIVVLISFFIYSSIAEEIIPQTHNSNNYIAFLRSGPLMIMIFVLGYIYFVPENKEEAA